MKQDAQQLLRCLNTHKRLYELMLEKGEKKRRAVIENNIADLENILEEEKELIKQIEAVENLRIKSAQDMAKRLNIEGEITHDKLMERDSEAKKEFGDINVEIKTLLNRMKDLNGINGALLQKRLAYIEDVKSSFFDDPGNNYGADGKDKKSTIQNMNLFDRMV